MVLGSYCRCCFCNNRRIDRSFCKSYESSLRRIQTYCPNVVLYDLFREYGDHISIIAVFVTHFQKAYVIMAIGSVLFLLSDAVLSNTFFGRGKDKPIHLFVNHFLYYAGQYLIAASVMFA